MKVHFCHARCTIVLQLVQFDEVQKCTGTNGYNIVSQKGTPGATWVCTLLGTFPYFYFLLCNNVGLEYTQPGPIHSREAKCIRCETSGPGRVLAVSFKVLVHHFTFSDAIKEKEKRKERKRMQDGPFNTVPLNIIMFYSRLWQTLCDCDKQIMLGFREKHVEQMWKLWLRLVESEEIQKTNRVEPHGGDCVF